MERIYRKHMTIKHGIYYFSAQLLGGGVFEERNVGKQEISFTYLAKSLFWEWLP
jgi:hypothetical protein